MLSVVIAANKPHFCRALNELFQEAGCRILGAGNTKSVLHEVSLAAADLIVIGVSAGEHSEELSSGLPFRQSLDKVPVFLITDQSSEELAIQAVKCGFSDYLKFPLSADDLCEAIQRWCATLAAFGLPRKQAPDAKLIDEDMMIGNSAAMGEVKAYLGKVAPTDSNVLITGETGTGKELVAKLIHRNSKRRQRPFVSINCAAIPDSLLESELFGFEKGAFTGAHAACDGKLKQADRGTVFFDEIGDMSPYAQAKILRAIECHELQRLGARGALQVDIRVIAATNLPIEKLAAGDRFRKDLFFRLNVAHIHLPPLRERKDELLTLAQHFVAEFNHKFGRNIQTLSAEAIDFLFRHNWPGNIRELKNLIESAFIDLPHAQVSHIELPAALPHALRRVERTETSELNRLVRALSETSWNKSQAAKRLQWSRMTLYRKMKRYRLLENAACP